MNKTKKLAVGAICALGVALVVIVFALFHSYFDRGKFEVKEANWSSSGRVAMIAERSDHEAVSGDVFCVVSASVGIERSVPARATTTASALAASP